MISEPVRLAVIGLGRGFALSARALYSHDGIDLIAAAARSQQPRIDFAAAFGGKTYSDYKDMLQDPAIEMVYVATPHELHIKHVSDCLRAGKHVVVEKPLAINLNDASSMVALAESLKLQLLVGPSHSYDEPVVRAARVIEQGSLGKPRMLHMLTSTDFMYRPRRQEELDTRSGGGVVFSQVNHQVDIAMRLLNSHPVSVFAKTGALDAERATESICTAILGFANGATATLTYSGKAHFNTDTLMGNVSELGVRVPTGNYGSARRTLAKIDDETAYKKTRFFSGLDNLPNPKHNEQFGQVIVFCERGDIQLETDRIVVYRDKSIDNLDCPFSYSRSTFSDAIVNALRGGTPPVQTGAWGFAALAACIAILKSADTQQLTPVQTIVETKKEPGNG